MRAIDADPRGHRGRLAMAFRLDQDAGELRAVEQQVVRPFELEHRCKLRRHRGRGVEDAESGYNGLISTYSSDLKPKPEGVKKIYSILMRTNPKLQSLKPESIIDDSLIQKIHASGY